MSPKAPYTPPPASTIDILAYYAITRPEHVAILEDGVPYRYAQLYQDVCKTVTYLRSLNLGENPKAAVEVKNLYMHLILTLGMEALGICSMSFAANEAAGIEPLVQDFDLVLCTAQDAPTQSKNTVILDQAWATLLSEQSPEQPLIQTRFAPDAPYRIIKTSGTTGSLKTLTLTWDMQNRRLQQFQFLAGMTGSTRYAVALGFSIQAYYTHCTACLRAGGTCIADSRQTLAHVIQQHDASHVTLIPHALIDILDHLPPEYQKPTNLIIFAIGAQVSGTIRQRVKDRLATNLIESYATNEAAYICTMQADGIGAILPGVDLEVVNDAEEPVYNQPGVIRMRSETLILGYRDDPATTKRMFKQGWFYPGDLGILNQNRILKLIGRADDQLNIRGIKVAPHPIEEAILNAFDFKDVGLCMVPDAEKGDQVWLAIVTGGKDKMSQADISAITPKLTPLLPSAFGATQLVFLDRIPRTATGKIQRDVLRKALRDLS